MRGVARKGTAGGGEAWNLYPKASQALDNELRVPRHGRVAQIIQVDCPSNVWLLAVSVIVDSEVGCNCLNSATDQAHLCLKRSLDNPIWAATPGC